MRVDVNINGLTGEDVDRAVSSALHTLGQQVLKDCNFYCKEDTESLIKSSLIHSDLTPNENGEIILRWVMPYAEFQYDFPGTRTDKNPNACPHWCEAAENNHKREWDMTFVSALHREGL